MIVNDLDRHLTIAYVMNKMELGTVGGPRSYALVDAAYTGLQD